jgi:hypothetical protein
MIFFAKVVFSALPGLLRGVDPLDFLAPLCVGLGVCAVALLAELEKRMARRRASAKSRAIPHRQPPPDDES